MPRRVSPGAFDRDQGKSEKNRPTTELSEVSPTRIVHWSAGAGYVEKFNCSMKEMVENMRLAAVPHVMGTPSPEKCGEFGYVEMGAWLIAVKINHLLSLYGPILQDPGHVSTDSQVGAEKPGIHLTRTGCLIIRFSRLLKNTHLLCGSREGLLTPQQCIFTLTARPGAFDVNRRAAALQWLRYGLFAMRVCQTKLRKSLPFYRFRNNYCCG